jgi:hypothetical protein
MVFSVNAFIVNSSETNFSQLFSNIFNFIDIEYVFNRKAQALQVFMMRHVKVHLTILRSLGQIIALRDLPPKTPILGWELFSPLRTEKLAGEASHVVDVVYWT